MGPPNSCLRGSPRIVAQSLQPHRSRVLLPQPNWFPRYIRRPRLWSWCTIHSPNSWLAAGGSPKPLYPRSILDPAWPPPLCQLRFLGRIWEIAPRKPSARLRRLAKLALEGRKSIQSSSTIVEGRHPTGFPETTHHLSGNRSYDQTDPRHTGQDVTMQKESCRTGKPLKVSRTHE